VQEVLDLIKKGYSYRKVAKILSLSPSKVKRICLKYGLKSSFKPKPRYSLEVKEKAINMAKKGYTNKRIAEELKVSLQTVGRWCKGIKKKKEYDFSKVPITTQPHILRVVELAKKGLKVKDIAKILNLKERTVRVYLYLAFSKKREERIRREREEFLKSLREESRRALLKVFGDILE